MRNTKKILVGKPQRKTRLRWSDNISVGGWSGFNWLRIEPNVGRL